MGGYGRDICAAAMISGVSADEYAPDALGVLYGLGCAL
jgi:hypothetical protein